MYPYNNFSMWYPPLNGNPPLPTGEHNLEPFTTKPGSATPGGSTPNVSYIPNGPCMPHVPASHTAPAVPQHEPARTAAVKGGVKYRNGTFYEVGATYEGVVTRRSSSKGFGFLRATHRLENVTTLSYDTFSSCTVDLLKIPLPDCIGHIFMHESHVIKRDSGRLNTNASVRFSVALHRGRDCKQAVDVRLVPVKLPPSPDTSSGISYTTDSQSTANEQTQQTEDASIYDWMGKPCICLYDPSCERNTNSNAICKPMMGLK